MAVVPTELPKYLQISEYLTREIRAGRLVPGQRLPPERDLAATHRVALGTMRKALGELTARGVIERRQGSGNYVLSHRSDRSIYAFFRLERPDGGGLPKARTLSVARRPKPCTIPAFGVSAEAWRIRRVRYLDTIPVASEEIWLDAVYCEALSETGLSESLYHFYRAELGLLICRVEDRVGVDAFPEWSEEVPKRAVCGLVERLGFTAAGESAEASRTWFDPATARYVATLE